MTTRRQVLQSGVGLAAILASGKAPAAFVRSMLAARQGISTRHGGTPSPAPYDAEIEYLESSGTQWIDLPYTVTQSTTLRIKSAHTSSQPPSSSAGYTIAGVLQNVVGNGYFAIANNGSKVRYYTNRGISNTFTALVTDTLTFTLSNGINESFISDGIQSLTLSNAANYGNYSYGRFGVFAIRRNLTAVQPETPPIICYGARIWFCQITDGSVPAFDLIPVRVGTIGYLFDRVSGQLYGNVGTDDFILGPDI